MGIPNIALRKRLPGPPYDWPAPDRTYRWLKFPGTPLCGHSGLGVTYLWLQFYLSTAQAVPTKEGVFSKVESFCLANSQASSWILTYVSVRYSVTIHIPHFWKPVL